MSTKLVRKVPRGVELTSVGHAFLSHVKRIRLSLEDVAHEVADLTHGRAGHLRIGCGPDMIDLFVQRACSELLLSAAKVTLSVTAGINDVLFPALRNGEYDRIVRGLPAAPYEDVVHEHLLDDEFIVYGAAGPHRAACRPRRRKCRLSDDFTTSPRPVIVLLKLRYTETEPKSGNRVCLERSAKGGRWPFPADVESIAEPPNEVGIRCSSGAIHRHFPIFDVWPSQ